MCTFKFSALRKAHSLTALRLLGNRQYTTDMNAKLFSLEKTIPHCTQCKRLRTYCAEVALKKRRAFSEETYWGKPVSGFGDQNAKLVLIGLAPAAHGANRTGRMFTGDQSGLWLYRALHRSGFSNQPESYSRTDELKLQGVYVTSVVKCAPPANKPLPKEIENCSAHLKKELELLTDARVYVALGQIALKAAWKFLEPHRKPLPKFSHLAEVKLSNGATLLCSYHPSQQNTFTRRLTEPMFDAVFNRAKKLL